MIYGPTAVGKSDFGEQLAPLIKGEIINGDLGQCYAPLSIGTAKPDWRHSNIPHHLFDILNEPKNMTVVEYREKAIEAISDIFSRGKIPIIIGGSGFYLKSLFFPPGSKNSEKEKINIPENERWQKLFELDPKRAEQIHPHDLYRINRALEIFYQTGKKASEQKPEYKPDFPFIFINISRTRSALYNRINERTAIMLKGGWIDEVKPLMKTEWKNFLLKKKLIGYDDIIQYLDSDSHDLQALTNIIAQKTRNYAKRQISFGKMLMKELLTLNQDNTRMGSAIATIEIEKDIPDYENSFIEIKNFLKK